jgi:hypothetical protein
VIVLDDVHLVLEVNHNHWRLEFSSSSGIIRVSSIKVFIVVQHGVPYLTVACAVLITVSYLDVAIGINSHIRLVGALGGIGYAYLWTLVQRRIQSLLQIPKTPISQQ